MFILVNTLTLEEAIVFFFPFYIFLLLCFSSSRPRIRLLTTIMPSSMDTPRTGYDHGHSALQVATRDIWEMHGFPACDELSAMLLLDEPAAPLDVSS